MKFPYFINKGILFVIPVIFFTISGNGYTQGVTIGSNTPPDPSTVLDLQSVNGGFALPRLTTSQRNSIQSPVQGLQVYNLDTDCLEAYFPLSGWRAIFCDCNAFPNPAFSAPSGTFNNPITISGAFPGLSYSWVFESGTPGSGTGQNVQVTWSTPGTYAIHVIATDSAGCSSSLTDSITISACQPFTLTFNNCGQTGRNGPSQSQCNAVYGAGVVTVLNGIQQWQVPESGTYRIEVAGAQGGDAHLQAGGEGAIVRGDILLSQGETLNILIGQKGENITPLTSGSDGANSGGGGGTFVYRSSSDPAPLFAAGGGGGASSEGTGLNIRAWTRNEGRAGINSNFSTQGGVGGTGGQAPAPPSYSYRAGVGAGWFTGGNQVSHTLCSYTVQSGAGPSAGGTGGLGGGGGSPSNSLNRSGGFGGGGGASGACNTSGSGGGGGFSGGGVGNDCCRSTGGGGGSFIDPAATQVATSDGQYNQSGNLNGVISNLSQYNSGHGYVIISRVCP